MKANCLNIKIKGGTQSSKREGSKIDKANPIPDANEISPLIKKHRKSSKRSVSHTNALPEITREELLSLPRSNDDSIISNRIRTR